MIKKEEIKFRVTKEQKEFIRKKAFDSGYDSMTAFLVASAYKSVNINLDDSAYFELVNQVQRIGTNINTLIRDIRFNQFYTKQDISRLESELSNVNLAIQKLDLERQIVIEKTEELSISELNKLLKNNKQQTIDSAMFNSSVALGRSLIKEWINILEHEGIDDFELDFFQNLGVELSVNPEVNSLEDINKFIDKFNIKLDEVKGKLFHPDQILEDQDITDMFEIARDFIER